MYESDSTVAIIAVIGMIITAISPMVVTVLRNKYEEKMYHLRFYEEHRAKVIERYISSAEERVRKILEGKASHTDRPECNREMRLYVPKSVWQHLNSLEDDLQSGSTCCDINLNKLIEAMSEYPPRVKH